MSVQKKPTKNFNVDCLIGLFWAFRGLSHFSFPEVAGKQNEKQIGLRVWKIWAASANDDDLKKKKKKNMLAYYHHH